MASVAIAAVVLGAAALIVALTRPTNSGPATAAGTTAEPTYTAAETAAAHQKLCEVYKLAARAVQIATNGDNPAFANIATVNGAVMLQQTLNTTPALVPGELPRWPRRPVTVGRQACRRCRDDRAATVGAWRRWRP